MGRRSQRSRSGQSKDRSKRAARDSENTVNTSSDTPSVVVDDDGENGDGNSDESSEVRRTDNPDGEGARQNGIAADAVDDESANGMAGGYASTDEEESPQTCCPSCLTIFEVSAELLSSTDTRVRCGECLGIFDALANLRQLDDKEGDEFNSRSSDDDLENESGQADSSSEPGAPDVASRRYATKQSTNEHDASLDVTYADFSLFSADAALPEIDYLDETREVPAFDFDDPGGDDELDETYSETLFAHGPEVDARSAINESDSSNAGDDESPASEIFEDSEDSPRIAEQTSANDTAGNFDATLSGTHTGDDLDDLVGSLRRPESDITVDESPLNAWWLRGALSLLVLCLAVGLYGYRERESLQHNRFLRPALESFCSLIGCRLAEPVDLSSLQVLKRSVFSHPKLDNVLVINIGFVNKASFGQRFPILEIRLTDRNGGLVVKNSFEPSDYLDNWQPGDVFDAGKRLDISLNVEDPGNKAMSFELDFR